MLVRRLELPEHIAVARDIEYAGNTGGASVPLAMQQLLDSGGAKPGDLALLIGYGAGFVYAAQAVRLPEHVRSVGA
jgi:beta-ketoacyl ACP synthase